MNVVADQSDAMRQETRIYAKPETILEPRRATPAV
jgi:hypothetical protein